MFDIDTVGFPALLLDRELNIIAKNEAASVKCAAFRVNSSITRYLSKADIAFLQSMKRDDCLSVTLRSIGYIPALAFFDGDYYLIRTNVIISSLSTLLKSLSGFQVENNSILFMLSSPSKYRVPGCRETIRHILFIQQRISDYINISISGQPSAPNDLDVKYILGSICYAAKKILSNIGRDIMFNSGEGRFFVRGSRRELEYALFSCIAMCFLLTKDKRLQVDLNESDERVFVSYCFSDVVSDEYIQLLTDMLDGSSNPVIDGEAAFILMYVKEIVSLFDGTMSLTAFPSGTTYTLAMSFPVAPMNGKLTLRNSDEDNPEYDSLARTVLTGLPEPKTHLVGDKWV